MLNFDELFFQEHQKQMLKTLPFFSKALFCFYGLLTFVHPFFIPPPNQWLMSIVSGISAIVFALIAVYVTQKGKRLSEKNIVVVISLMAFLGVSNTFLHLILTKDFIQTTNIIFICIALSAVGFSNRFFFLILIFVNCSWLSVIWFYDLLSDPAFIHFFFTMAIGSFISSLMAITRYKLLHVSVMEIMRRKNAEIKLQAANSQLSKNANIDTLTGLPNRRSYNEFLKQKWEEMEKLKAPISIIIADVDHFKKFNDEFGHQVGDEVLVIVGKTLEQCLRCSTDLIARYGGEEFVAIIPNITAHKTLQLAERMRQKVSELDLTTKQITISIGTVTIYPDGSTQPDSLFQRADKALYEAKAQGRNRVCHAN